MMKWYSISRRNLNEFQEIIKMVCMYYFA